MLTVKMYVYSDNKVLSLIVIEEKREKYSACNRKTCNVYFSSKRHSIFSIKGNVTHMIIHILIKIW